VAGVVYLVGAGPGDPGLLTLRAAECLGAAEVILADHLVNPVIVARFARADAEVIVRPPRREGLDQDEINRLLVEHGQRGKIVVRLKGGDPFIFGRGGEEAEVLAQAGIPFEVVPGVTAAVAVPAYAGIPLTHRGAAGAVAVATGHEADQKNGGEVGWDALARGVNTLVLFMGVTHLEDAMRRLVEHGRAPETPVAVIEWGTTPRQKTVVGTVADIASKAAQLKPPALVVVGDVVKVRERLSWFERRRLHGKRILVLSTKDEGELPLRADGAEVVRISPLQVLPCFADVKTSLSRPASVLAFASAHAVDALLGALVSTGQDVRALFGVKLAAVGAATAARLAEAHLVADLVARGGGAELAEEIRLAQFTGPVRILGAKGGRSELADGLRAAGYEVDAVEAYETVPDDGALSRAAREHRARPFDAVAFASPRGAKAFLEAARIGDAKVGAIGQTTRAALEELGLTVHAVPDQPSLAALVDALAEKIE
jgi:uroporphyrinogen III methyltransferase / synthase